MKAVILCAGEGTRMRPLTFTTPKQLLKVGDKAVLEHIFHELPDQIDEVILVVKYLAGQIQDYFGEEFLGKKIHYVTQVSKDYGTWIGLNEAKHLLGKEKFLVLLGDDILDKDSIEIIAASLLCLEKGGVIALPTDTIYGLAADYFNSEAKEKIFLIKKRPQDKILPVFVDSIENASEIVLINDLQKKFLKKVWPGKV